MFGIKLFKNEVGNFAIAQADRKKFVTQIVESSAPSFNFYFLVFLSSLIVAFGLARDNFILLIGGMLVTPLLSPLMAVSLGFLTRSWKVIMRSTRVFIMASFLTILTSAILGLILSVHLPEIKLVSLILVDWPAFFVALVAGVAASYNWAKPELKNNLTGVAVTVTLIPPLSALGLALSKSNMVLVSFFAKSLMINILGILVGSLIIFWLLKFSKAKNKIIAEIKEEEKNNNNI